MRGSLMLVLMLMSASHSLSAAETVEVTIKAFKFEPREVRIKAGGTVRWLNAEKRQYHSVWFEQNGWPESEYLFPGESYEKSFAKSGTYPYRCGPHPKMTGVVHVE